MFSKLCHDERYGYDLNSHDIAKLLALSLMVIDHLGFYFFQSEEMLRAVGRASFPIWFFLIGYGKSQRIPLDLVVLAVLMEVSNYVGLFFIANENISINYFLSHSILISVIVARFLNKYLFFPILSWKLGLIYGIIPALAVLNYIVPARMWYDFGLLVSMFALCGYMVRRHPKTNATNYCLIVTLLAFAFEQTVFFKFAGMSLNVLMLLMIALFFYMRSYRFVPSVVQGNVIGASLVKLCSRNSQYFYFIHIQLFAVTKMFMIHFL